MRDASGQVYMRNRYYDPATGQFTQADPIGLAGGLNAFGFADGDPVSYSDPYGLAACCKGQEEEMFRKVAEKVAPAQPFINAAYWTALALFPLGGGGGTITRLGLRTTILSSAARLGTRVLPTISGRQLLASAAAHEAQELGALAGKSWSTQRSAFWKAEAGSDMAEMTWGAENVARMQRGRAPQLRNVETGAMESVELHHFPVPQRSSGTEIVPVTPAQHRAIDPYRHE